MFGTLGIEFQESGGGGGEWQRPSDWPAMPASQAEHIDILAAVTNDGSNFCAVSATVVGGYTVDWGDGVIENVASGVQRDHLYSYSDVDLGAVTSRGYKTANISIYPQVAGPITAFNIGVKNATAGLASYSNPWLDIQINTPSCTSMSLRSPVEARFCERVKIVAIGAITTLAGSFNSFNSMQSISFPEGSLTEVNSLSGTFLACYSLRSVEFPSGSLANVTTIATIFSNCSSLKTVSFPAGSLSLVNTMLNAFTLCYSLETVTFPDGSLSLVTTLATAFNSCLALKSVSFPAGSLSLVTTLLSAFASCVSLRSITFPAGAFPAVTTIATMFNGCSALSYVEFPVGALAIVATTTSTFLNCTGLRRIVNCAIPVSFTIACNIGPTELDEIYTALPVVVGQTITVTGNWGTTSDTPAIATGKGWTVTG